MNTSRLLTRAILATATLSLLLAGRSSAQCPTDDALEPNEFCSIALPGPLGTTTGLVVTDFFGEDYFTYTVPAGMEITIDALFSNASGDIDILIYDDPGTCSGSNIVSAGQTNTDNEQVLFSNGSAGPVDVTLLVILFTGTCNNYDLVVSITPNTNPCFLPGVDDAEEENDTCLSAVAPSANPLTDLFVSKVDEDFYTASVNPGETLAVDVTHIAADGDLDIDILDASDCTTVLATGQSGANLEQATYANTTGAVQTVIVRVYVWAGGNSDCNTYDLDITTSADPCVFIPDDGEEDNDDCMSAVAPSANSLLGLVVSKTDEDWYVLTVPANSIVTADVLFATASGDVDAFLIDPTDCTTVLDASNSGTDDESVSWVNTTASPATVLLQVQIWSGSLMNCNLYNLDVTTAIDPCPSLVDDAFEDNDDCASATSLPNGLTTGLAVFTEAVDPDWYSVTLANGATITVDVLFTHSNGDVEIRLDEGCTFFPIDFGLSSDDNEQIVYTNTTGAPEDLAFEIYIAQNSIPQCNSYDLMVDISGGSPGNITPYCFGDGSGTTCPCGNNSTAGHLGGCANSVGNGAVLTASGNASLMADTLNLDLSSASQNSFALLVSGINQLPQMGGCIGCGLVAFDGLRCAGGGFLRHGSRALNGNGETGNGWGPPGGPGGGLIAANGFTAGSTRNFFAFYRENDMAVCQTGQNSSNGVSVLFQP